MPSLFAITFRRTWSWCKCPSLAAPLLLSDTGTNPHHRRGEVQIRKKNASAEGRVEQELRPSSSEAFEGVCFPLSSAFLSPLFLSPLLREVLTAGTMPKVSQVFLSLLMKLSNLLPAPVGSY